MFTIGCVKQVIIEDGDGSQQMIINEDPDHQVEEQVVVEHSFNQPYIINQLETGELRRSLVDNETSLSWQGIKNASV